MWVMYTHLHRWRVPCACVDLHLCICMSVYRQVFACVSILCPNEFNPYVHAHSRVSGCPAACM